MGITNLSYCSCASPSLTLPRFAREGRKNAVAISNGITLNYASLPLRQRGKVRMGANS
jgi:hypothetical protein